MSNAITRRDVLAGAGALAGAALCGATTDLAAEEAAPRIRLRIMETSDIHMNVLGWDYFLAKPDLTAGLERVASPIRASRKEVPNTLLFDNGDLLQGTPLADDIFENAHPTPDTPHPIFAIMRELGYDAATVGNHEFNYGLEFLEASLSAASFPYVCANVERIGGEPFLPRTTIIERTFKDEAGNPHVLRIGVIGFVTPQITMWDKARLEGKLQTNDIVLAAKRYVPELRGKCDVLVALCHSGIAPGPWVEGEEHATLHLSTVPGIDVILTGHAHRVLPGKDYEGMAGIDAVAGRLNGVPTVMPGFWGSHLGVVDLELQKKDAAWSVQRSEATLAPIYRRDGNKVIPLVEADPQVAALIAPAHAQTLRWIEQPVGAVDKNVHSYFVWTGLDPATAIVNAAQTSYARPLLAAAGFHDLPILSSMAPYRAGYTPDGFIDIAAGPVTLREAAGLYQYSSNVVVVLKLTGAQIVEWLEYAARCFNTIDAAGTTPQALVNKRVPSYNFDIISGVTYKIDLTKPNRYTAGVANPSIRRIFDVEFEGRPIDPQREFAVVTNSYRADGGGSVPALIGATILLRAPDTNKDAVVRYFRSTPAVQVPSTRPWSFAPLGKPVAVYFDTGPRARDHIGDLPGVTLENGEPGYARVRMMLS